MTKKAYVGNASDKEQVKKAGTKEYLREKQKKEDLQAILGSVEGRRFLWSVLEKCGVFQSIWTPSAQIHYLAGQQDIGHWLMAQIVDADQDAFLKMQKEASV